MLLEESYVFLSILEIGNLDLWTTVPGGGPPSGQWQGMILNRVTLSLKPHDLSPFCVTGREDPLSHCLALMNTPERRAAKWDFTDNSNGDATGTAPSRGSWLRTALGSVGRPHIALHIQVSHSFYGRRKVTFAWGAPRSGLKAPQAWPHVGTQIVRGRGVAHT